MVVSIIILALVEYSSILLEKNLARSTHLCKDILRSLSKKLSLPLLTMLSLKDVSQKVSQIICRVIPSGPKNASVFYTATMKIFQEEWNAGFDKTIVDPPNPQDLLDNASGSRTSPVRTVFGSMIVIDDIFLYGTNVYQLLRYFASVATIFLKYRLSFKLAKCNFFSKRVEYLGYYLLSSGNCPAKSKFDLITDWPIPVHGTSLLSFIGLCTFYNCFSPWFEVNIKPLRVLQRKYHRKAIPQSLWSKELRELFLLCKTNLTTSPVLARFDSNKPT